MKEKPFVVNGHVIDTNPGKLRFLETNDESALEFFRCHLCKRVVSLFDLRKEHACPHCGHARISPTNLTFWEKIVQIVKHPKVWEWKNQGRKL